MTQYPQPPQTCRLTVFGCELKDGTEIEPTQNLEWRGEVTIRYNHDLDNLLKLYAGKSYIWIESSMLEFLGRPDKAFSLSDLTARGENPDLFKGMS